MRRSLFLTAFVALVVILVHVDSTTTAQITAQGNALSALASAIPLLQYQSVSGDDTKTNWHTDPTNYNPITGTQGNTSTPQGWCLWAGVTCDPISKMVTAIGTKTKTSTTTYSILSPKNGASYQYTGSGATYTNNLGLSVTLTTSHYSLTGTIPAAISILTTLKVLDLAFNQLTGTLPSELGALTALTHLNLGNNYFIGTVPSTLSALTNLNYLFLNNTLLSGTIPQSLVNMKLYNDDALSTQNIYNGLNSIATFNSIKAQGLAMCSMTGIGTSSIVGNTQSSISGINWVSCTGSTSKPSYNQYIKKPSYWDGTSPTSTTVPPYQPPWCAKSWAGVTCDTTNSAGPNGAGGYNVISIYLHNTGANTWTYTLKNRLPSSLGDLSALTTLNLYGHDIIGSIPASLASVSTLASLDLYGNNFVGQMPLFGSQNTALTSLILSSNSLSGIIPPTLGNLGSSTAFTMLDIGANSIVGSIPSSMSKLTGLLYLDVHSNSLNGPIPTWIGQLASLTNLNLDTNKFTGPFPTGLSTFSGLTVLSSAFTLQNNFLTGYLPGSALDTRTATYALNKTDSSTSNMNTWVYSTQYSLYSNSASGSQSGAVIQANQVFTGLTVALASAPVFQNAYLSALSAVAGVPQSQITLGKPTAITLSSRRLDEGTAGPDATVDGSIEGEESTRILRASNVVQDVDTDTEKAVHETSEEKTRSHGASPPQERELLAFNPQPLPSTSVSYPFTIVAFSSQGTVLSLTKALSGAAQTTAITTMVVASTGVSTIVARTPAVVSSSASAVLTPTVLPTAMPTYTAVAAQPMSRTIIPKPFSDPSTKASRCKQCANQNYCPVPLGC